MEQLATPIEEIVAGLIVWLARERIQVDRRRRCPGLVREFLRWQHTQRQQQRPCGLDDYLSELHLDGAPSAHAQVKDAVHLLERYLKEGS